MKFFSKILFFYLDSLTQQTCFLIIKIIIFWGDLSGISAKTATLTVLRSNNGYHIFVTNRYFDYKDKSTIDYLIDFKCDINYIICCYIRGFSVRISKKSVEESDELYDLIYESSSEAIDDIIELIDYQKDLIKIFGKNITRNITNYKHQNQ